MRNEKLLAEWTNAPHPQDLWNYETYLEYHLEQTRKELEELQDAIREWDEQPTGLRRPCIRTAIQQSQQRRIK